MSTRSLSLAHRAELRTLTGLAENDLSIVWNRLATADDPIVIRDHLATVLPKLVTMYGSAAGTLAADYYDDLRTETKVGGRFSAIVAQLPDAGRTESLAGWAVGPLFAAHPDYEAALVLASGGLQRIIADASRDTVKESVAADKHALTMSRIVGGGACEYCSDLEGTDDSSAHDHCFCTVEPVWT